MGLLDVLMVPNVRMADAIQALYPLIPNARLKSIVVSSIDESLSCGGGGSHPALVSHICVQIAMMLVISVPAPPLAAP